MGLSDADQQRVWIIAQKIIDEKDFSLLASNMQIVCNLYNFKSSEGKIKDKVTKMTEKIKKYIKRDEKRTQDYLFGLRIEMNDVLSEIINTIDPKNMFEFDIHETSV